MIKSYKSQKIASGIRFFLQKSIKNNRWKMVFTSILILLAIFFGAVVAVKTDFADSFKALQEINIKGFKDGFVASYSAFFARTFSLLFNILLLTLFSFSAFMIPLAELLLIYRGYLFGLNFALIFVFYGLGSMITAVVVILPCQLLTLFLLMMFYLILANVNSSIKKYGRCECNRFSFVALSFLLVMIVNLLETLLLFLLNGRVIMVM